MPGPARPASAFAAAPLGATGFVATLAALRVNRRARAAVCLGIAGGFVGVHGRAPALAARPAIPGRPAALGVGTGRIDTPVAAATDDPAGGGAPVPRPVERPKSLCETVISRRPGRRAGSSAGSLADRPHRAVAEP